MIDTHSIYPLGIHLYVFLNIHCFCYVECHHGMARPQVADGGDDLQIWRVSANILNKQSQTADKRWYFRLGVGRRANFSP
jgi:hypothetical protein